MKCEDCINYSNQDRCPADCDPDLISESTEAAGSLRGLKDHEIQEMVNAIRDATSPMIPHQCLRSVIARAATKYLEGKGLRIDQKQ